MVNQLSCGDIVGIRHGIYNQHLPTHFGTENCGFMAVKYFGKLFQIWPLFSDKPISASDLE